MAFRLPSDVASLSPNRPSFGIPGQTKVSGDCQKETTHEICCLAAELVLKIALNVVFKFSKKSITYSRLSNNHGGWKKHVGVRKMQNQLDFFCQFLS